MRTALRLYAVCIYSLFSIRQNSNAIRYTMNAVTHATTVL